MRVLIADDETVARRGLRRLLSEIADVEIAAEAASGADVVRALRAQAIDVVLLDINMPGMTGLDVASAIGAAALPLVIFVTAYDQHAVRAFELDALDYLVKPFSEARLRQALARARTALGRQARSGPARRLLQRLRIEEDSRIRFIAMRDIRWIEAQDYCVLLHLDGERILRRGTLKRLMEQLDPRSFVRVHRSAAVNVRHVRDLVLTPSGSLAARLVDGTEVPVAPAHREALEARLCEVP